MSASQTPGGRGPRRRRGDALRHRLPQRPRLPARGRRTTSCRSCSRDASAPTRRSTSTSCGRRWARGSRAGSPSTGRRSAWTTPSSDPRGMTIPGTDDVRRVDARRPDAARRRAGRRDHALEARAPAVRRRRPPAPLDHGRPGRHGILRRRAPGGDPAPGRRAAAAAGHEQRPVAVAGPEGRRPAHGGAPGARGRGGARPRSATGTGPTTGCARWAATRRTCARTSTTTTRWPATRRRSGS